ncbi:YciI family protein [Actinokineospora sp.]|uniref:YciI family protein n=1 Tax=Actinokineospora sp. TaxID=1872133 RepID=UPI004037FA41
MTWFTVDTLYIADRDRLAAVRPAHRDYLRGLADTGQVLAGGPWADGTGGFFVVKVADRAELDAILAVDPYTTEGIAAERTVREWTIGIGPWAA